MRSKLEKLLNELNEVETDVVIKELIDTNWSGSDEEQMKAIQLLKGLATSDDPKAKDFMKTIDKAMSGMKTGVNEIMLDATVALINAAEKGGIYCTPYDNMEAFGFRFKGKDYRASITRER